MYSTNGTSLLFLLFLLLMSSLESLCWFVEMLCTHSCRLMVIVSYVIFSLNKYRETLHFRNYKFDMKIGDGLIFSVSLVLRFRKGMTMTDEMNKILKPTQTTTKKPHPEDNLHHTYSCLSKAHSIHREAGNYCKLLLQ